MSNPAIVLLTDPSRCGLGDVHYLVQALLEIQQMGEHATPQAFCDHPAAAKDFMAAYTHAYPKLVLESREIPTPDHLEALITTGQVGPLARPQVTDSFDGSWRLPEQNGFNAFPLVVLTLGNPQALLDAMRQNHLMKDNISLIDIVPDGASDLGPVSIADAVASRGRGVDGPGEDTGPSGGLPQLDEVARASATESADFVLRDDQIGLDTVEPVRPPSSASQAYDANGVRNPGEVEPPSPAAPPQPVVEAGQAAPSAGPQDSAGAIPSAEPAVAPPAQAQPAWPTDSNLIPPSAPPAPVDVVANDGVPDDDAPDDGVPNDGGEDQPDDGHPDGEKPEQPPSDSKDDDEGDGSADAHGRDDDVHYEPVGTLSADADVLYPAADHVEAPATLRELAAALADDGILDTDPTADIPSVPQDDRDSDSTGLQSILSHTSHGNGVTFENLYPSVDPDTEDASDSDVHHPLHHESDL